MTQHIRLSCAAVLIVASLGLSAPALAQTTTTSEPSREELEIQVKALQWNLISLLQLRKAEIEKQRATLEMQVKTLALELINILQRRVVVLQAQAR